MTISACTMKCLKKYKNTELISTNQIIDKVVAGFGLLGYCGVSPDKTYIFPVCDEDKITTDTNISPDLKFPVKAGDVVGSGTVTVNGENYGSFTSDRQQRYKPKTSDKGKCME